jgi:hypothetical protein
VTLKSKHFYEKKRPIPKINPYSTNKYRYRKISRKESNIEEGSTKKPGKKEADSCTYKAEIAVQ